MHSLSVRKALGLSHYCRPCILLFWWLCFTPGSAIEKQIPDHILYIPFGALVTGWLTWFVSTSYTVVILHIISRRHLYEYGSMKAWSYVVIERILVICCFYNSGPEGCKRAPLDCGVSIEMAWWNVAFLNVTIANKIHCYTVPCESYRSRK